jgi:hypothetical protein
VVESKETPREVSERENLFEHRRRNFRRLLGDDCENEIIIKLIEEDVDYHELEKLLENGCSKELAVKIV